MQYNDFRDGSLRWLRITNTPLELLLGGGLLKTLFHRQKAKKFATFASVRAAKLLRCWSATYRPDRVGPAAVTEKRRQQRQVVDTVCLEHQSTARGQPCGLAAQKPPVWHIKTTEVGG